MSDLRTRQAELEYESVILGQKRYEEGRVTKGESDSLPGREQTKRAVPVLQAAIEGWIAGFEDSKWGTTAGRMHRALPYLVAVLPEQAAYLTVRHALDGAASNAKATAVALAIGSAIEDHVNLVHMKDEAPGLYRKVMLQVKTATAEHHRKAVLRHVVKKFNLKKLSWEDSDKLHLGMKLLELFDETSKLITLRRDTEGRHNTQIKVVFTDEAQEWFAKAHEGVSQWTPVHMPMLVPPRDWTTPYEGGYLTKALRRASMIQSHLPGAAQRLLEARETMGTVFAAVNAVQRTPWRINKRVMAVMKEVRLGGPKLEALLADTERPLPVRPAGLPDDESVELTADQREALGLWKREAALVHTANARIRSKRVSVAQKMTVATKFEDEAAIYFPHYLDFRGRLYPYASYFNPQSDDVGRSLLEFAEGKALGKRGLFWLKVHVANLFGVDKVSYAERVKWVDANMERLLRYATAPLEDLRWADPDDGADSPWCALAACMELAGALVAGEAFVSHLPIAMDGSCSGLQHYSAMLRDPVGGAAVNLIPQEKPGDIYTQVAKRAQDLSDGCANAMSAYWQGRVVRKIAKQPTMTMCYSATVFGMQGQIEKAVRGMGEEYLDDADIRQASQYMAQIVWDAIGQTVVAARQAMDFLKSCAEITNEAKIAACWTAPSGFLVEQGYREVLGKRVDTHYKGQRVRLTIAVDGVKLDGKKQKAGIAPNFVHSLDSSHLMATVVMGMNNGLDHWACIHDSFGVHASDVDLLHTCIRESFIEQYSPSVLARFREEIAGQLPPELATKLPEIPPTGSLDLESVRDSAYFFA